MELTFLVVRDSEGTPAGRSSASTDEADLIWLTLAQYINHNTILPGVDIHYTTVARCCFTSHFTWTMSESFLSLQPAVLASSAGRCCKAIL
jgi:hypothetical protein